MLFVFQEKINHGIHFEYIKPDEPVTREQMMKFIYSYYNTDENFNGSQYKTVLSKYKDLNDLSSWAETSAIWCVKNGYLCGKTTMTLNPQDSATRAELAQVYYNIYIK